MRELQLLVHPGLGLQREALGRARGRRASPGDNRPPDGSDLHQRHRIDNRGVSPGFDDRSEATGASPRDACSESCPDFSQSSRESNPTAPGRMFPGSCRGCRPSSERYVVLEIRTLEGQLVRLHHEPLKEGRQQQNCDDVQGQVNSESNGHRSESRPEEIEHKQRAQCRRGAIMIH